ncbi:MAG: hypothetical protein ABJO36_11175 [Litorimonas sp.]
MFAGHNYERFTGWRLIALLGVFTVYTLWMIGPGPFGELARLENYDYLQGRIFYSGYDAKTAIDGLDDAGRRLKFTALGFDLIYMVLQTWVFEAVIAFGLTSLGLMTSRWRWLLLAPMGFLLFDFLEDSSLALVLATSSELIGSFAGVFTLLKFVFFVPLVFISLGLGVAGIMAIFLRKRKRAKPPN